MVEMQSKREEQQRQKKMEKENEPDLTGPTYVLDSS